MSIHFGLRDTKTIKSYLYYNDVYVLSIYDISGNDPYVARHFYHQEHLCVLSPVIKFDNYHPLRCRISGSVSETDKRTMKQRICPDDCITGLYYEKSPSCIYQC